MEKLFIFLLMIVYASKHVTGDPIKCFVCTGAAGPDDACAKAQAAGTEQDCAEAETKCVTKFENDAVSRACAAADVADAPNSVVTCEAAGCNGIAWSELGNDTKPEVRGESGDGDGSSDSKGKNAGSILAPILILKILPLIIILKP